MADSVEDTNEGDSTIRRVSDKDVAGAAILALVSVAVMIRTWSSIYHIVWASNWSRYIALVPVIFVVLVAAGRKSWPTCPLTIRWPGPLAVALGGAMWSTGNHFDFAFLSHGGAVVVFFGCLIAVLGMSFVQQHLPAFVLLPLAIPLPYAIQAGIAKPLAWILAIMTSSTFERQGHDVGPLVPDGEVGVHMVIDGQEMVVDWAAANPSGILSCTLIAYAIAILCLRNTFWRVMLFLLVLVASCFYKILWVIGVTASFLPSHG